MGFMEELKRLAHPYEDEDEDDLVYVTDGEEVVVDTNEVLDSGFNIDPDGPEDIMDVFGDLADEDAGMDYDNE